MAWSPGPALSRSLDFPNYDERDPWTKRFLSEAENGELALNENAMNGLESAAGAVFVDLIRNQARKIPFSYQQSTGYPRYPRKAVKEDSPMLQYEPFRNTCMVDPRCVPQLRYANIRDSGADHDKREAHQHWHRAGRTWSRIPRFRKGETAFTHDPSYKPLQAVGNRWYEVEAGPKTSLAGKVQQSRWQSSHSVGQPTRSRLPRDPEGTGPGPATYYLQDPWEVKEVCGQIPKSSMFCKPTRRLCPPNTSSVCVDFACSMTRVAFTGHSALANNGPAGELSSSTAMTAPSRSQIGVYGIMGSGGDGSSLERKSITRNRSRSGHHSPSKSRSKTVGPVSFGRAERPHVADEPRRREESYGKQVTRLLTRTGDVVITMNRRRISDWGKDQSHKRLVSVSGDNVATDGDDRSGRNTTTIGRENTVCRGNGQNARQYFTNTSANRRAGDLVPIEDDKDRHGLRIVTPQTEALKLLPHNFSPSLLSYREPGQAEMPVVFCAKTALISQPRDRGVLHNYPGDSQFFYPKRRIIGDTKQHASGSLELHVSGDSERYLSGSRKQDRVVTVLDRANSNVGNRKETRTRVRPSRSNKERSSCEAVALVARIDDCAKTVVAEQAGPKGTARIPSPQCTRSEGEKLVGIDEEIDQAKDVAGDEAHDTMSSIVLSNVDSITFATRPEV